MKKYILYLSLFCGVLMAISSCSKDEDTSPSYADQNLFSPVSEDNSQTAQLRREFYTKVGSYLLFNDTLSHKQNGVDSYGNPIWNTELVDLDYAMAGSGNGYIYTFDYLKDYSSQAKAAQAIEAKLASRLGSFLPYSVLLVDKITTWQNDNGVLKIVRKDSYTDAEPHPLQVLGSRCYAISMNSGEAFTNDQYFINIMSNILVKKLGALDESVFADFYSYCSKYYGNEKYDLGMEETYNDEVAKGLGFLRDWNDWDFPSKENDLKMFITVLCTYTPEQFETEYANYPIVIAKFKVLRKKVIELGVKLDN